MKTRFAFTKMSGAGNDFVVIDNRSDIIWFDKSAFARALCSRHFGIGADGLLLVERSSVAEFAMRYYNADGSYGGMCGNGGRCIARFVHHIDGTGPELEFEALDYIYKAEILNASVVLHMKQPNRLRTDLLVGSSSNSFGASFIDSGSPHVVIEHDDIDSLDIEKIGREIRRHQEFAPDGANVNFVQILGPNFIKMRTYERGVESETLACGTGAVASAVLMSHLRGVTSPVNVLARSGESLRVHFTKSASIFADVKLEGSAHFIFNGKILYDPEAAVLVDSIVSTSETIP